MPDHNHAKDPSGLAPELVELVRALQASLADKRVRQQLQPVDSDRPSKLESAFSAQQAKRASRPEVAGHPQLAGATSGQLLHAAARHRTVGVAGELSERGPGQAGHHERQVAPKPMLADRGNPFGAQQKQAAQHQQGTEQPP